MAYQSKLLQFLQTQWWKGRENLGLVWRNLKTQTQWAVQILAYPFYGAIQTVRVLGRQWEKTSYRLLSSNEELTKPSSPSDLVSQVNLDPQTNFLACRLGSRELIISDRDGKCQPLPQLLKPVEEKQLRYEVASWQRRFKSSLFLQESAAIVPIKTVDKSIVLPLKWFWQGVTWMQRSPLAVTLDLFGESKTTENLTLPPRSPVTLPPQNPLPQLPPNPVLKSIDRTFAQWEQSFPNPPLKKIINSDWWDEASFQLFNIPKNSSVNFEEQSVSGPSNLNSSAPSPFESLLKPSSPKPTTPSSALAPTKSKAMVKKPFRALSVTPNFSNQGAIELQQQWQKITMNNTPLDWTVDWDEIEVECTDLGYQRHPLEIVLTQVDVLLVKVENWLHYVWQWWHSLNKS